MMWAQALCTSRVTMTVHNDKSHTIADDTAAMISNTAAPAAPAKSSQVKWYLLFTKLILALTMGCSFARVVVVIAGRR